MHRFISILGSGFAWLIVTGTAVAAPSANTELAAVIRGLMLDKSKGSQDYLVLKRLAKDVQLVSGFESGLANRSFPVSETRYGKIYRGTMPLTVSGAPLAIETMTGSQNWTAYIAGPNSDAKVFHLLGDPVSRPAGASYFRAAGLNLLPLVCDVGNAVNYDAFYLVQAAGKRPAVLNIRKSEGSAGTWYSYSLYWEGPSMKDLPASGELLTCGVDD